jgi:hypothetical protein
MLRTIAHQAETGDDAALKDFFHLSTEMNAETSSIYGVEAAKLLKRSPKERFLRVLAGEPPSLRVDVAVPLCRELRMDEGREVAAALKLEYTDLVSD